MSPETSGFVDNREEEQMNETKRAGGTVSQASLSEADIGALRGSIRGSLLTAADPAYDETRQIWNATVDRRPLAILRALGASDVIQAIRFAKDHRLPLAVRGGGHNIAGNAVCDHGLMLDLSCMKSVRVDVSAQRAIVEPGATLADLDRETQAFGLVVPTGINSTTGIAGLTLGGGFGWTTRKFGMTIDNLLSVDLVTADGTMLHASDAENTDLFWAIRGGGGNFGVVTAFEFALHRLGPQVMSGLLVHPFDQAATLLKSYRRLVAEAPDELTCWCVMRKAPPLPFIPQEWHGREVLVLALCYAGPMEAGEKAVAPFRALGRPIADVVGPHPFVGWQAAFDPLLTPGARNYWKSHDFVELSDGAINAVLAGVANLPGPECEIFIAHVGGAMAKIKPDATAYPQRQSHFIMNVHTRWREAAQDEACIGWARKLATATAPHATGSVYVNFMPEDETDRVKLAYGRNHPRLAAIKRRYDPDNLFRLNQNILPG
jgi:FAD/FMN-containing dehydrogenase